ncbi:acyl-CoA thioesterase [Bacillus solitudinis]|uniref:acyl-CoA thioesterase n=1 Tax=Bacillus solitudinis TaxID=2014074 RepID=UPI000C245116|nr:thioesterase family protein [Bacillus solitudinis]
MQVAETTIEVRYAETDQMGVVHHSNYVVWFEVGRTQFIKTIGYSYAEMEREGILAPVTDIQVSYKHPTKYGDIVTVKTWVGSYNGLRVTYQYEVLNQEGILCVTGASTHVCVRKDTFRPISMKKHMPEWHAIYEKVKAQPE